MTDVHLPGDFAVCSVGGNAGKLISIGEWLAGDAFGPWDHAFIYLGGDKVLQAEPGGSKIAPLGKYGHIRWSTGKIQLTAAQRAGVPELAARMTGIPYSALDYFALAAHHLDLPVPLIKDYIAAGGHEICSQLVDDFMLRLGVHLFKDGRWPGYVMPADLAELIC
jgi:hypothetical protein